MRKWEAEQIEMSVRRRRPDWRTRIENMKGTPMPTTFGVLCWDGEQFHVYREVGEALEAGM